MISRRRLAAYAADQIVQGQADITKQLAAYLIEHSRVKDAALLVKDIEAALLKRGIVVAEVNSARPLNSKSKADIEAFVKAETGAKTVAIRTNEHPELIGGAQIKIPGRELDGTIRSKLNRLIEV